MKTPADCRGQDLIRRLRIRKIKLISTQDQGQVLRRGESINLFFYHIAEFPSLGPHWLHWQRNALQTVPGTAHGINTVPKQNQMFLQLWTRERCDPTLGWADPKRHWSKPAPALGLSKTAVFLCLTGVTIPVLRPFIQQCIHLIMGILACIINWIDVSEVTCWLWGLLLK